MATIYEVSKLAGVSLATVSRVMNGTANVSDNTREKVHKAMNELGYVPNSIAISLASKRSNCVGILVPVLDGVFFGEMMHAIEGELRKQRKHVVVTAGHADEEQEREGVEFLLSRNCDALIVHAEELSDEYLVQIAKGKTPIYILNRYIEEIADRCISLDNEKGGYLIAKYVLELGHRNIVTIAGPNTKKDARHRLNGLRTAMGEYELVLKESHVYEGSYQQDSAEQAINHFVEQNIEFTAVICANDQMAIGAMAQLRQHGLVPGENVAVVGFDNVEFAACTFPRLTTIDYPIAEMGRVAADMILRDVYEVKLPDFARAFEPTLIIRESVNQL